MIGQVGTALLLLVAVVGLGTALAVWLHRVVDGPLATRLALVPLGGVAIVGAVTLLLGHLQVLGPWVPYGLAAGGVLAAVPVRRAGLELFRRGWQGVVVEVRRSPVALIAVGLGLVVAAVCLLAAPWATDEVQYHWPAALAWADAGGWNESPYRHVNAYPFMEVVYTAAATQHSYVAAHLMHLVTLVGLGLAAAGLARSAGVRAIGVTAAASVAMPVIWSQAQWAYNDTAVGAFSVLAVAVAVAPGRLRPASTWLSGAIVAVAVSIKPSAIAVVGVIAAVYLLLALLPSFSAWRAGRNQRAAAGTALLHSLFVAAPAVVALLAWAVRQQHYTGHLVDPSTTEPPSADALTRLPTAAQQAYAPLMPFVTGVVGQLEPWGGRTSVVVQIFLIPALVYVVWRRGAVLQRFAVLAVPAWLHWIVLGLVTVRTRFHDISWVLLVVALRVVVEDVTERHPRLGRWVEAAWTVGVVVGVADVSLDMVRVVRDQLLQ